MTHWNYTHTHTAVGPILISCQINKETVFWTVDEEHNHILGTKTSERASQFYIIPTEDPFHPADFMIAFYRGKKETQTDSPLSRVKKKWVYKKTSLPLYVSVKSDFFGSSDGPLTLKDTIEIKHARFCLHSRVQASFLSMMCRSTPVSWKTWLEGEQFYINCSHRSFKVNGYIAMRKESQREDSEHAYRTFTMPFMKDPEDCRGVGMLFRLQVPGEEARTANGTLESPIFFGEDSTDGNRLAENEPLSHAESSSALCPAKESPRKTTESSLNRSQTVKLSSPSPSLSTVSGDDFSSATEPQRKTCVAGATKEVASHPLKLTLPINKQYMTRQLSEPLDFWWSETPYSQDQDPNFDCLQSLSSQAGWLPTQLREQSGTSLQLTRTLPTQVQHETTGAPPTQAQHQPPTQLIHLQPVSQSIATTMSKDHMIMSPAGNKAEIPLEHKVSSPLKKDAKRLFELAKTSHTTTTSQTQTKKPQTLQAVQSHSFSKASQVKSASKMAAGRTTVSTELAQHGHIPASTEDTERLPNSEHLPNITVPQISESNQRISTTTTNKSANIRSNNGFISDLESSSPPSEQIKQLPTALGGTPSLKLTQESEDTIYSDTATDIQATDRATTEPQDLHTLDQDGAASSGNAQKQTLERASNSEHEINGRLPLKSDSSHTASKITETSTNNLSNDELNSDIASLGHSPSSKKIEKLPTLASWSVGETPSLEFTQESEDTAYDDNANEDEQIRDVATTNESALEENTALGEETMEDGQIEALKRDLKLYSEHLLQTPQRSESSPSATTQESVNIQSNDGDVDNSSLSPKQIEQLQLPKPFCETEYLESTQESDEKSPDNNEQTQATDLTTTNEFDRAYDNNVNEDDQAQNADVTTTNESALESTAVWVESMEDDQTEALERDLELNSEYLPQTHNKSFKLFYKVDTLDFCRKFEFTSEDFDNEVSDNSILDIYPQIERWEEVAVSLGLTSADIEDIDGRAMCNVELKRLYMLQKWKNNGIATGAAVTYRVLLHALMKYGYSHSAIALCKLIPNVVEVPQKSENNHATSEEATSLQGNNRSIFDMEDSVSHPLLSETRESGDTTHHNFASEDEKTQATDRATTTETALVEDQPIVEDEAESSSNEDQPIVEDEAESSSNEDQPIVEDEAESSGNEDQPIVEDEAKSSGNEDQPIIEDEAESSGNEQVEESERVLDSEHHTNARLPETDNCDASLSTTETSTTNQPNDELISVVIKDLDKHSLLANNYLEIIQESQGETPNKNAY